MKDKTVIITGAAGGLGRAFALGFAKAGARVVVCDTNLEGAEQTAGLISEEGGTAIAIETDVTSEVSLACMVISVLNSFGKIDILVNNAAIYAGIIRKPFYEITEAEWDRVMDVNLKGTWMCSKSVVAAMKEKGGKIINVSSATVFSGSAQWSHYVASKAGVIGLTRTMARELGEFNINVNTIAPGFTLTHASLSLMENAAEYGLGRSSLKRPATAGDMVGTVLFLASEAAAFMTGQTLVVDGGKQFI